MTSILATPELDQMHDWEDLCYDDWPFECIYCNSVNVVKRNDNALCLECGRWQVEEDR